MTKKYTRAEITYLYETAYPQPDIRTMFLPLIMPFMIVEEIMARFELWWNYKEIIRVLIEVRGEEYYGD